MTCVERAISDVQQQGFSVLRAHFPTAVVDACRQAFWPRLMTHVVREAPTRGPNRYYLAMPLHPPCFAVEFFFDPAVLTILRALMEDRIVADQWGCDVPLRGSQYQGVHVDYQRPLFPEAPDLRLPAYAMVVSFGLVPIAAEHGPIEIAPGTHRMNRMDASRAVQSSEIRMHSVLLDSGDVLIRHPWTLHRGTPNTTDTPRALASIRYVRRWYADASRDVEVLPRATWKSLTAEQQTLMRFPIGD
jgi:hypothetical protein